MKKYLLSSLIFSFIFLLFFAISVAAPVANVLRSILPEADNTYFLGTSSPRTYWANIYTRELTVSTGSATTTIGSATSTFAGGLVAQAGVRLQLGGFASCNLDTDANGFLQCGTDADSGAGGAYPFTAAGPLESATTSAILLRGSSGFIQASSTRNILASTTILGSINVGTLTATSGTSIINALSLGTALSVGNGGTGLTSCTDNRVVTGGATLTCEAGLTYDGTTLTVNSIDVSAGTLTGGLLAGALDAGGATSFEIPNGTGPTVNAAGEIALDTTSGNLVIATSSASTQNVVFASATSTLYALIIASTSPDFFNGGVLQLPEHDLEQHIYGVRCEVDSGTSVVLNLSNGGTTDTNTVTCDTDAQHAFTSNSTFAAGDDIRIEIGAITGAVDYLLLRFVGYRVSN